MLVNQLWGSKVRCFCTNFPKPLSMSNPASPLPTLPPPSSDWDPPGNNGTFCPGARYPLRRGGPMANPTAASGFLTVWASVQSWTDSQSHALTSGLRGASSSVRFVHKACVWSQFWPCQQLTRHIHSSLFKPAWNFVEVKYLKYLKWSFLDFGWNDMYVLYHFLSKNSTFKSYFSIMKTFYLDPSFSTLYSLLSQPGTFSDTFFLITLWDFNTVNILYIYVLYMSVI